MSRCRVGGAARRHHDLHVHTGLHRSSGPVMGDISEAIVKAVDDLARKPKERNGVVDRFKNVLIAASPGHLVPVTLRAAMRLAERNRARLAVVDVMESMFRMRRLTTVEGRIVDVQAELMRHRQERLRLLAENTRAGTETRVKVLVGEPFIEVIRHVLGHGNDLVIVGGAEVEPWATPEFSSGVMHLLRKCPVPVWVMRPQPAEKLRILALVDPDPEDPVRDSLNDLVLTLAVSLAGSEDGELHVGHAWELAGESILRSSPFVGLPGEEVDVMVEAAWGVHREQSTPGRPAQHHGDRGRGTPHSRYGRQGLTEARGRSRSRVDRDGHGGEDGNQWIDHG